MALWPVVSEEASTWGPDVPFGEGVSRGEGSKESGGLGRVHLTPFPCVSGPPISQAMPVLISTGEQASQCRAGTRVRVFNYGARCLQGMAAAGRGAKERIQNYLVNEGHRSALCCAGLGYTLSWYFPLPPVPLLLCVQKLCRSSTWGRPYWMCPGLRLSKRVR